MKKWIVLKRDTVDGLQTCLNGLEASGHTIEGVDFVRSGEFHWEGIVVAWKEEREEI